jgi:hypothetical protein
MMTRDTSPSDSCENVYTRERSDIIIASIAWPCIIGGTIGWFWWLTHSQLKAGDIAGLSILGLIILTIFFVVCWEVAFALLMVVAVPCAVIVLILQPIFQVSDSVISRWVVLGRWPNSTEDSEVEYCMLCAKCKAIIQSSRFITGNSWLLASPNEYHGFHDQPAFRKSKDDCHLCNLLWYSRPLTAPKEQAVQTTLPPGPIFNELHIGIHCRKSFGKDRTISIEVCNKDSVPIKRLKIVETDVQGKSCATL